MLIKSHLLYQNTAGDIHSYRVKRFLSCMADPAIMGKQVVMSSSSITFYKLLAHEPHREGNSAVLLLSYPVSPTVQNRYLIIEDNWGFFFPSIKSCLIHVFLRVICIPPTEMPLILQQGPISKGPPAFPRVPVLWQKSEA